VLEGEVDHPVGVGRRLGQAVQVVEVALLDDGAEALGRITGNDGRKRAVTRTV
jgi:hypothetical protein